jgi:soluble lytic murein transglycosylase
MKFAMAPLLRRGWGPTLPPSLRSAVLSLFAIAAIGAIEARGQVISDADLTAMRAALAAAAAGSWAAAYADTALLKDPLPNKIVHWLDFAQPGAPGNFDDIARFIERNPGWPGQGALRRHAEEALAAEPDRVAADWLRRHPPVSAAGKVRAAELLLDAGDIAGGTAALRAAWVDCDFGPVDEKNFLLKHHDAIRSEDDRSRLDRLLWERDDDAALRMLPRVSPDHRALAEARLALAAGAPTAGVLLARVAPRLRDNAGLLYAELQWLQRRDMTDAAAQILLNHPGDPVHPAKWAAERQIVARRLLAAGDPQRAYRIVMRHGAIDGNPYADAEFLQGFIALRYMQDPALAFDDFSRILTRADSPYAKARAGYWGGRAAAAEGRSSLAAKWYAAGAEHMATFYGQLAAHQLGDDAPPHPVPEPASSAAERSEFDANELVRAARIFFALGDHAHGRQFILHLANAATTPAGFAMLADLAQRDGQIDLAISVAKRAIAAGTPLLVHGYPTVAVPSGGIAEHALLYAIVRQESAFETAAVSPKGALGLMQLLPTTASSTALKAQLPFSLAALTTDGLYNITLGRTYLEELLEAFGGSYALAIAAYNAGPTRVRQWLRDYGDPRGGSIGMVDWIELIPIAETRTYVERVLESLQIYRAQLGRSSAFSLVSDLAR